MTELDAEDRYQVRKLQMDVDKKALDLQKTQQDLDRFVLEMEHKYNLINEGASIDPKTGMVNGVVVDRPAPNGKTNGQALLRVEPQEAAA